MNWLYLSLSLLLVGCHNTASIPAPQEPAQALSPEAGGSDHVSAPQLTPSDEINSVVQAIEICGSKLSDGRKMLLAQQLSRITSKYMQKREHRDAFIGLVCIESRFDSTAKSHVGAAGMAQIMPRLAPYFSKECDLGTIDANDLLDTEVNLTVGACHFSKLLTALDGNIALALAGYNSGQDSDTTKRLAKLAEGHPETMAYIAKFYSYINKLQIARESK